MAARLFSSYVVAHQLNCVCMVFETPCCGPARTVPIPGASPVPGKVPVLYWAQAPAMPLRACACILSNAAHPPSPRPPRPTTNRGTRHQHAGPQPRVHWCWPGPLLRASGLCEFEGGPRKHPRSRKAPCPIAAEPALGLPIWYCFWPVNNSPTFRSPIGHYTQWQSLLFDCVYFIPIEIF